MNKINSLALGATAVLLSNGFTTISSAESDKFAPISKGKDVDCPQITKATIEVLATNNTCPVGSQDFASKGVTLSYTQDECKRLQPTLFANHDKYQGSYPTEETDTTCTYEFEPKKGVDKKTYKAVEAKFTKVKK